MLIPTTFGYSNSTENNDNNPEMSELIINLH